MKSRFHAVFFRTLLAMILFVPGTIFRVHADEGSSVRSSVIKIYVTFQRANYATPWQSGRPSSATGSGFILKNRRILTNAHVVSDARFLQVQKDGDARKFPARVEFAGHDCDLAVLSVEEDEFFEGTTPVEFAVTLPVLNEEVTVFGYPMGGTRLSVTRGVVSRIDYGVYAHSGADQHLVLQVDAAINPGNSGGPVLYGDKVVGLAFQGIAMADNIGYAIPIPVINHFLKDIEDGTYHGYPEIGIGFMETQNPALREYMKLPAENTGIAVHHVDPFGSAHGYITPGDVLLAIDGSPIAYDGTIELEGNTVLFAELLERKQWGESVSFRVTRNGQVKEVSLSLTNPQDPFAYRNLYDEEPRFLIRGGLVFSPLNREILRTVEKHLDDKNVYRLFYYTQYAKMDKRYGKREEFVVLIRRIPHAVNTYAESFLYGILKEINGIPILRLNDIEKAMQSPLEGYHVIQFDDTDDLLILDASSSTVADEEIRKNYGIGKPRTAVTP